MLLTLAFYNKSIKWILPTAYLMSSLPAYLLYWLLIRVVTLPLNKKCYHNMESCLYETLSKQIMYILLKESPAKVFWILILNAPSLKFVYFSLFLLDRFFSMVIWMSWEKRMIMWLRLVTIKLNVISFNLLTNDKYDIIPLN